MRAYSGRNMRIDKRQRRCLGGSTRVKVYKNNDIDFLILEIRNPKKDIYVGNWSALSRVEMHWRTDDVLVINNVEYDMKAE